MTSTEKQEIKIKTKLAKRFGEDCVALRLNTPRKLLRVYARSASETLTLDTGAFYRDLDELVSGELDGHDCVDICEIACNRSGLYTFIDRTISRAIWFLLVNMAKLTLETGERQEFTLVLD